MKYSEKLNKIWLDVQAEQAKKFATFRSDATAMLHKEGITNFKIEVTEPKETIHQCQLLIHDNVCDKDFEVIIVKDKDLESLMPMLIKKIKEVREENEDRG